MNNNDGFIPILAIFYAVFHPTQGTKIVHQVPEGAILTSKQSDTESVDEPSSLFHFDTVKNYIIPKPQLCNKLISFKITKYKVIGFPVNIENASYSRNSFNFNFCFVFPYESGEVKPYELAIRRIGKMFQVLEEQLFLLSKLEKDGSFFKEKKESNVSISNLLWKGREVITPGHSKTKKISLSSIESLIHQIYQDLNNYSECCIPLDNANSVDIKLFPILPPPVNIKAFQVPITTVRLSQLVDVNWDPTMINILPYIDGLNSIKRISELSNSNYLLTKQCIQHLMHYKCIEISDIFQFGNIYAPTNHIGNFLSIETMAEECQAYVITQQTPYNSNTTSQAVTPSVAYSMSPLSKSYLRQAPSTVNVPKKSILFYLYRSLNQGQTIKDWYVQHKKLLINIDIRRFVHFGVLRGIIYRVHSYPILDSIVRAVQNDDSEEYEGLIENMKKTRREKTVKRKNAVLRRVSFNDVRSVSTEVIGSIASNEVLGSDGSDFDSEKDESDVSIEEEAIESEDDESSEDSDSESEMVDLFKMLKGYQHFDAINTELHKSRVEVEQMIRGLGSVSIINS